MGACIFETSIQIGCEGCAVSKSLKVGRSALATFAGLDTSRVPIKATEHTTFTVSTVIDGSKPITQKNFTIQNEYSDQECEGIICPNEGRINEVATNLEERIINLARS